MSDSSHLRLRLKNCLQTILELKDDIGSLPFGDSFMTEIDRLESFLDKLADIAVNEQEVQRVELATSRFLNELDPVLAQVDLAKSSKSRLQ